MGSARGEQAAAGGVARVRVETYDLELVADVPPEGRECHVTVALQDLASGGTVGTPEPNPSRELRSILGGDRVLRGCVVPPVNVTRVMVTTRSRDQHGPEARDALASESGTEDVLDGTFGAGGRVDPRPLRGDCLEARNDLRGRDRLLAARGRGNHGGHVLPVRTARTEREPQQRGDEAEDDGEGTTNDEVLHGIAPFEHLRLIDSARNRSPVAECDGLPGRAFDSF